MEMKTFSKKFTCRSVVTVPSTNIGLLFRDWTLHTTQSPVEGGETSRPRNADSLSQKCANFLIDEPIQMKLGLFKQAHTNSHQALGPITKFEFYLTNPSEVKMI